MRPIPGIRAALVLAGCIIIVARGALAQEGGGAQVGVGDGVGPGVRFSVGETPLAERGAVLFRSACGFCHGAEGRGAAGPDLTRSVYTHADSDGTTLGVFLKVGKPINGMPPFPDVTAAELAQFSAFLRFKAASSVRPPLDPASVVVGDAAAGLAYFTGEGHCAGCHSPTGDLKAIGTRLSAQLIQGRMFNPRVVGVRPGDSTPKPPPATVRVTLPEGPVVSGRIVQINDFFVTLVDSANVRRTILRDNAIPKVEVSDPLEAHRQQMFKWTDSTMHDVTAYLVSLK